MSAHFLELARAALFDSSSPHTGKHIDTVLPNFVLAKHLQRLASFVTDITGVNPKQHTVVQSH